jgi:hypothetical protein
LPANKTLALILFQGIIMFKKFMICLVLSCLGGCTLLTLPLVVVDTAVGVATLPIKAVGKVVDAVNDDEEE